MIDEIINGLRRDREVSYLKGQLAAKRELLTILEDCETVDEYCTEIRLQVVEDEKRLKQMTGV